VHSDAEPLIQTEKTSELRFHPGIFRETKIDSDRTIETGSQYFLGRRFASKSIISRSGSSLEAAWQAIAMSLPLKWNEAISESLP
jgi:hypothetical protein